MAAVTDKFNYSAPLWTGTIGTGGVSDASTQTIPLTSTTGLTNGRVYYATIDRVDANSTKTPTKREVVKGLLSGSNLINCVRGTEGTAQAHSSGAVVEILFTSAQWNDLTDGIYVEHDVDGTHKSALVTTLKASGADINTGTSDLKIVTPKAIADSNLNKTFATATTHTQVATPANPSSGYNKLYFKSDEKLYKLTSGGVETEIGASSAGTAFWSDVPGTPTRVSDTQFTITDTSNTNKYDLLFKKGTIIKWDESGTFQIGMVISSSYGTNTVTINIVGDSLTAGFASMKYAIPKVLTETFIIPGTLAAATDIAKTWYTPCGAYFLSADAYVKTAGTTNSTVFDINDDGSTKWTTKPTITSTTTSDIDNVADNPSTEVAAGSLITVDIDSVSTTAPVEAYVIVYWIPSDWRYRS